MKIKNFIAMCIALSLVITSLISCQANESVLTYAEAYSRLYDYNFKFDELLPCEAKLPTTFVYDLPNIDSYNLLVKGGGDIDIEIFLHANNAEDNIVSLISYVAQAFNKEQMKLDGKIVSVSIRLLEENLAEEYILKGIYPQGYICPNELYGIWLKEQGVNLTLINDTTLKNSIGIAIEKHKFEEINRKFGNVTIDTIIEACKENVISFAYSNPINSSVGLNFIASVFSKFNITDFSCVDGMTDFSEFHKSISLVSFNNEQLENAIAQKSINAFAIDYQTFMKKEKNKDYEFILFGTSENNPIYSVGEITENESKILESFSDYFSNASVKQYIQKLGYSLKGVDDLKYYENINSISTILYIWKKQRAENEDVRIAFLMDTSKSMENGGKLEALKNALLNSTKYIDGNTKIGLFTFNAVATNNLNVSKFDTEHKKCFVGAINNLKASGKTSLNNALLFTHKILLKKANEESKLLIILLTDGGTNKENDISFEQTKRIINALNVPIYVIEYGKVIDDEELKKISELNNGICINADTQNIGYVLKTIFRAEG